MEDNSSKMIRLNSSRLDYISDLPRDVIYKILECLPLKDAARMCFLSHKWHDIWTSNPYLVFNHAFFESVLKVEICKTDKLHSIVSKILFQHEGPILKFALYVPPVQSCLDVTQWISYLSRNNGLRDFSLCSTYRMPLWLSSRLFSCVDLEKLKLTSCVYFSPPPNFRGFPKLISLELDGVKVNYSTFENLIGSCPLLQNIVLKNYIGLEHKNFTIDAPNLRNLTLDWAFESVYLKSCDNLVSASIGMSKLVNVCDKASLHGLLKVLTNSIKLERLCLRSHLCRIFFKEGNLGTFQNLRNLELVGLPLVFLDDFSSTISCVQSFPNIETLVIYVQSSANLAERLLDYNSDSTLHHLRYARVLFSVPSNTQMKFFEYLLACSPVLEKLVVHFYSSDKGTSTLNLLRLSTELNRFRRASRRAEVICKGLGRE
ncbi:F-box/FBD/LRR-repeat protein At1g13570 isoform X2 [Beta vulgaris subsp. vulgaris]|nr:F-box/FBD/LRR-repeat protein At1g13570 isoform X2 [Beta vulgaris subsp. vulgaris]